MMRDGPSAEQIVQWLARISLGLWPKRKSFDSFSSVPRTIELLGKVTHDEMELRFCRSGAKDG